MEFRILGPLEVRDGDTALPIAGAKQRALVTILLLHANEIVPSDRLAQQLWEDEPPESGPTALQVRVSQLRKALGPAAARLETRTRGYVLHVEAGELDLDRFQRLVEDADDAEPAEAAATLRSALALFRGQPLADVAYHSFAQAPIRRLEDMRLRALERRIDADLALGRHADVVVELEALVGEEPLRERFCAQLMLALYRSGRQAEALLAYQATRERLVDELGIEPAPALRELQRAILHHDPSIDATVEAPAPDRSIVVVTADPDRADALLALAVPLARSTPPRELILVALVTADGLPRASGLLREQASRLDVFARTAAFTSPAPASDIVRLAAEQEADLVLCQGNQDVLVDGSLGGELGIVLATAPCDVAVLVSHDVTPIVGPERAVLVPFGGADHDWAAVELAAWIVRASGATLRLVGREETVGGRDASRLLAQASLMIQRVVRVPAEPLLIPAGSEGILQAAGGAALVVFGLSERWPHEGLGETRRALVRDASVPTLLVRKGLRPGGIAPQQTMTRFTWSLAAG